MKIARVEAVPLRIPVNFSAIGIDHEETASFTYVAPAALAADTRIWKFGPIPGDPTPQWYDIPSTVAGNIITFTVTDGGLGDDDLMANGIIVDPHGPAHTTTEIPTLSERSLILLAGLLALAALAILRRRLG